MDRRTGVGGETMKLSAKEKKAIKQWLEHERSSVYASTPAEDIIALLLLKLLEGEEEE